jgi:hypothetical protein
MDEREEEMERRLGTGRTDEGYETEEDTEGDKGKRGENNFRLALH